MAQNWLNFTLVAGAPAAPIHPDPTLTDTVPYELSEQDQTQKEEPIPPKSPDLPTVERRLRFKQSRPPKTLDKTDPPSGKNAQDAKEEAEPIFSSSDDEAGAGLSG